LPFVYRFRTPFRPKRTLGLICLLSLFLGGCPTSDGAPAANAPVPSEAPQKKDSPKPKTESPAAKKNALPKETDYPKQQVKIIKKGKVGCFEKGAFKPAKSKTEKETKLAYCEASAIAVLDDTLLFASDKDIPGENRSSIFSVTRALTKTSESAVHEIGTQAETYFPKEVFRHLKKAEDFTKTLDGKTVLLTSGFDRIKKDSTAWHPYNTVMAFPKGHPEKAYVVNPVPAGDHGLCSLGLRKALARALANDAFPDGMPYFKVESLAVIPQQRILFGIREMGQKYNDFSYTITILQAPFTIKNDRVHIDEAKLRPFLSLAAPMIRGHKAALSSLHYDPKRKSLYLLTSYEEEVENINLGGFLFRLPLSAINETSASLLATPFLMHQGPSDILHFGHKPEGISLLDEDTLIVVHDDDRVLKQTDALLPNRNFIKQPEEAAYTIIDLAAVPPSN
jgi:hypothetical protein